MVIQSDPDDIVIKSRASAPLKGALAAIAIGCAGVGMFMAYEFGLRQVSGVQAQREQQRQQLEAQVQQLQLEIKELNSKNHNLLDSLAKADRQLQVDEMAYRELGGAVASSTDEIAALQEELKFYRDIVSPAEGRSGIQIQDLEISRAAGDGEYRYTIVLIQSLEHDTAVAGTVELEIEGSQAGEKKVMRLPGDGEQPVPVSFRYFQNIDGHFVLPNGYTPIRIRVSVHSDRENAPTIERWYPWPSV